MADRRRVGSFALVLGLVLMGIGAVGLVAAGGDADRAALQSAPSTIPSGPAAPTPTPEPSGTPTRAPSPTPSSDTPTLVAAFFDDLTQAIRAGSVGSMADRLHSAVIDRYGEVACEAELAGRAPDTSFDVAISTIRDPAAWDYVTDGLSTTIAKALTVDAGVTSGSATTVRELHVAIVDGVVRWFTDCGTPLGASPSP